MGNESVIPPHYLNAVVTGDARELAKAIPDNSIDLIFCDPIYWQIEDYEWVAQLGARVLVEDGNLIAQCGLEYLFQAQAAISGALYARPPLIEVLNGGFMQIWKHRSLIGYIPYLWATKSKTIFRNTWIHTAVRGGGKSQSVHEWGDSPHAYMRWIISLTQSGSLVLDPFTGGGTVPAVCKMLGRQYVAFEIDAVTADNARQRILNTQPPLPLVYDNQLELSLDT